MGLDDAIRADARLFDGTQEELSRRVCGSATGLRYKMTGYRGMHLRVPELVTLQLVTGGRNSVTAMARELGGVFLQLPAMDAELLDNSDLELELMSMQVRLGELLAAMAEAKRDGVIDRPERVQLDGLGHEVIRQLKRYLALSYLVYGADDVDAE